MMINDFNPEVIDLPSTNDSGPHETLIAGVPGGNHQHVNQIEETGSNSKISFSTIDLTNPRARTSTDIEVKTLGVTIRPEREFMMLIILLSEGSCPSYEFVRHRIGKHEYIPGVERQGYYKVHTANTMEIRVIGMESAVINVFNILSVFLTELSHHDDYYKFSDCFDDYAGTYVHHRIVFTLPWTAALNNKIVGINQFCYLSIFTQTYLKLLYSCYGPLVMPKTLFSCPLLYMLKKKGLINNIFRVEAGLNGWTTHIRPVLVGPDLLDHFMDQARTKCTVDKYFGSSWLKTTLGAIGKPSNYSSLLWRASNTAFTLMGVYKVCVTANNLEEPTQSILRAYAVFYAYFYCMIMSSGVFLGFHVFLVTLLLVWALTQTIIIATPTLAVVSLFFYILLSIKDYILYILVKIGFLVMDDNNCDILSNTNGYCYIKLLKNKEDLYLLGKDPKITSLLRCKLLDGSKFMIYSDENDKVIHVTERMENQSLECTVNLSDLYNTRYKNYTVGRVKALDKQADMLITLILMLFTHLVTEVINQRKLEINETVKTEPGRCYERLFHNPPDLGYFPSLGRVLRFCEDNPSNVRSHVTIQLGIVCNVSATGGGYCPQELYNDWKPFYNFISVGGERDLMIFITVLLTKLISSYNITTNMMIMLTMFIMSLCDYYFLLLPFCWLFYSYKIYSKPTQIIIKTYGSKGDKVPLEYYHKLLIKYGFKCRMDNFYTDEKGKEALDLVEDDKFLCLTKDVKMLSDQIDSTRHKYPNAIILCPQGGLGYIHNVVTYKLSPPANQLKSWIMVKTGLLAPYINAIFRCRDVLEDPDIHIASFKGYAPRSCDGIHLLKRRDPIKIRKSIIALGSSSKVAEPEGLDPATTWSTNPNSIYQYDDRTDHIAMFSDYEIAYTHGGAGTMATAASCGCTTISLDDRIDRNYKDKPEFFFTKSTYYFWKGFIRKLDIDTAFKICLRVFINDPLNNWWLLFDFLFKVLIFYYYVYSLISFIYTGLSTIRFFYPDVMSVVAIAIRLIIPGINYLMLIFLCTCVRYYLVQRTPKEVSTIMKDILYRIREDVEIAATAWHYRVILLTVNPFGVIFLIELNRFIDKYYMRIFLAVILTLVYFTQTHLDKRANIISMRFIRLENVLKGLPLYHVEFYNPENGLYAGIGISKTALKCQFYSTNKRRDAIFEVGTGIPTSQWEKLTDRLSQKDGVPYHAFSNCQTSAIYARKDFDLGFDLMILSGCMIFCSLLSLTIGVIATLLIISIGCFGYSSVIIAKSIPLLTALGGETNNFNDVMSFLIYVFSPSTSILKPELIGPDNYPVINNTGTGSFKKQGFMEITINGVSNIVEKPVRGISRPECTKARNGNTSLPHGVSEMVLSTKHLDLIEIIDKCDFKKFKGNVAVIAASKERVINDIWTKQLLKLYDHLLILTNEPDLTVSGADVIYLPFSGRELASARVLLPNIEEVTWFCFNNTPSTCVPIHEILLAIHSFSTREVDFKSVIWYGLHQASCSALCYKKRSDEWIDPDIYGADELAWLNKTGEIHVLNSPKLFSQVYNPGFKCGKRYITVFEYGHNYNPIASYEIDFWSGSEHSKKIINCPTGIKIPIIIVKDEYCDIGGFTINLGPLTSRMYIDDPIYSFKREILRNHQSVLNRLSLLGDQILSMSMKVILDDNAWETLESIEKILIVFNHGSRPLRRVVDPIVRPFQNNRIDELNIAIHPNPRFIDASYDATMNHYINRLNLIGDKSLSLNKFVRKIQRNPHVDLNLRKRAEDGGIPDGVDGQVIGNKELMIASLAKYAYSQTVDALLDDDIINVANVIINTNPDLYLNARIGDPKRILNHFMKFKKYSAGLPFIGVPSIGPKIKTRSDLKRAGWLPVIAKLAIEPYTTGEWYPGIAHAFSKSQVVNFDKLTNNPAKLRSVVATSSICNVQQGIMFYDLNNRHAPHNGPSKVGITLNGNALGSVFEEMSKYKLIYSLDATEFDRSMEHNIFKVEAAIRKAGFRNHSAYDAISKHIDCAIKQTQYSYIINLIEESWDNVEATSTGESKRLFDSIDPNVTKGIKDLAHKTGYFGHPSAPGGVIKKIHGGATGDSNTTYTNTVALDLILVYCVSKANGWKFDTFFEKCGLANTGDDNILGTDEHINLEKAFEIAKNKFGITFRTESTGNNILDQTFLGKIPKNGIDFLDEFERNNLKVPKFAVIHEPTKLLMRYSNFKADSNRNFSDPVKRDLYLIKKGIGYLNLTAHQPKIYNQIRNDLDNINRRLPCEVRKRSAVKLKIPSYDKVIKDWYKPGSLEYKGSVQKLRFTVEPLIETEKSIRKLISGVKTLVESIPNQLIHIRDEDVLIEKDILRTSGLFESHAFHLYVLNNNKRPQLYELDLILKSGPYYSLTDTKIWYSNIGLYLPIEGEIFERNLNYAILNFWWFTMVYVSSGKVLNNINKLRFGGVVLDALNLSLFTVKPMVGALNYAHYGLIGESNQLLGSLIPKDPYRYNKIAAYDICSRFKLPRLFSIINISKVNRMVNKGINFYGQLNSLTLFKSKEEALIDYKSSDNPWITAALRAKSLIDGGKSVMITAPTGTGKTRYLPGVFKNLYPDKIIMVVMPRRVLCAEFCKYPNVSWERRGQKCSSRIRTCTYGHLQAKFVNESIGNDYFYIFDEAHETSCEWILLREKFLHNNPGILLTATPTNWMSNYEHIMVDIKPVHNVTEIRSELNLEELLIECAKKYKRILVIHPSKREVIKLTTKFKGLNFSMMTSDNREVPKSGHVIATSIVDAGITIPGCDCVIDSGLMIVNHLGDIKTVNIDKATSIQRKGRTGRNCNGTYYLLKEIKPADYRPSPSVISALIDDSVVTHFKVECRLLKPLLKEVPGDNYVHLTSKIYNRRERYSISLLLKLMNTSKTLDDAWLKYQSIYEGKMDENDYYLLEISNVEGSLTPVHELKSCYKGCKPYYKNIDESKSYFCTISNNKFDIDERGMCEALS
nr:MAG: polyprotein [Jiangsu sediment hypo-like virus 2]